MGICQGCGKEISSMDAACPHCGTVSSSSDLIPRRSMAGLIIMIALWGFIFWAAELIVTAIVLYILSQKQLVTPAMGQQFGEIWGDVYFLVALGLAAGLTLAGKLPGTRKTP